MEFVRASILEKVLGPKNNVELAAARKKIQASVTSAEKYSFLGDMVSYNSMFGPNSD